MLVYSTMLEHMSPENKITVTAKLAQEVRGGGEVALYLSCCTAVGVVES